MAKRFLFDGEGKIEEEVVGRGNEAASRAVMWYGRAIITVEARITGSFFIDKLYNRSRMTRYLGEERAVVTGEREAAGRAGVVS